MLLPQGFAVIYEGLGEGPEQAKDRTHFTLKPLGPGQKFSFRIRVGAAASCRQALRAGVGRLSPRLKEKVCQGGMFT